MPVVPYGEFIVIPEGGLEGLSWATVADASRLRARLRLNRALAKPALLAAGEERIILQRIVHGDDMLPFYVLELGAQLGRAVCKIAFDDERDGTGFLIGPSLLVTNNHVLPDPARAREARCIFDFQLNLERKPQEIVTYRLDPDALFVTSTVRGGLDYTFVRIDPAAGRRYPPISISRGSFTSLDRECANIIQHPQGRMKRVAMRNNRILSDTGLAIRYQADADGGSSGSPVFNSDWQLIALHHAGCTLSDDSIRALQEKYPDIVIADSLNEGVKFSAIAADLERLAQGRDGAAPREVLRAFNGTDSLLGYFGGLGRPVEGATSAEKVLTTYAGDAHDVDVGFCTLDWHDPGKGDKLDVMAKLISDLAMDAYVLANVSLSAIERLASHLDERYGLAFAFAPVDAHVPAGRPTNVVLWNSLTLTRVECDWPEKVEPWFGVNLSDLRGNPTDAVGGRVFEHYPARFRFHALQRDGIGEPFAFNLVPLYAPALADGASRREEIAKIVSVAVAETIAQNGGEDWIVGGDFNEASFVRQMATLTDRVLPLGGEDEDGCAFAYLKGADSLIEHLFVSPNLSKHYGRRDYLVAAADADTPERVRAIAGHRPVLLRLSLAAGARRVANPAALPAGLETALGRTRCLKQAARVQASDRRFGDLPR